MIDVLRAITLVAFLCAVFLLAAARFVPPHGDWLGPLGANGAWAAFSVQALLALPWRRLRRSVPRG